MEEIIYNLAYDRDSTVTIQKHTCNRMILNEKTGVHEIALASEYYNAQFHKNMFDIKEEDVLDKTIEFLDSAREDLVKQKSLIKKRG